jgi:DNA-directed RNA polymerase sigma subunit (sigma70/sigma32)
MQLSRERIRQLEKKALGILRLKIDEIENAAA